MPEFTALFVVYADELTTFSVKVADTQPQTIYDAFCTQSNGEYKVSDIYDIFIIEGDLTSVGREYLGSFESEVDDDE